MFGFFKKKNPAEIKVHFADILPHKSDADLMRIRNAFEGGSGGELSAESAVREQLLAKTITLANDRGIAAFDFHLWLPAAQWRLVVQAIEAGAQNLENALAAVPADLQENTTAFLQSLYFVDIIETKDRRTTTRKVVIAEEIRDLWSNNKTQLLSARELYEKIYLYAAAAANLYGCIPMTQFRELLTKIEGAASVLENDQWRAPLQMRVKAEGAKFVIGDDEIFHAELENDANVHSKLRVAHLGKEIYFPATEAEFLAFADERHTFESFEAKRCFEIISKTSAKEIVNNANDLIEGFIRSFRSGADLNGEISLLWMLIRMGAASWAEELSDSLTPVYNNTPLWNEYGRTRHQLNQEVDFREYIKNAGENQTNSQQVRELPKVGRNDPCPCGSGKKYKKCCGKGI